QVRLHQSKGPLVSRVAFAYLQAITTGEAHTVQQQQRHFTLCILAPTSPHLNTSPLPLLALALTSLSLFLCPPPVTPLGGNLPASCCLSAVVLGRVRCHYPRTVDSPPDCLMVQLS